MVSGLCISGYRGIQSLRKLVNYTNILCQTVLKGETLRKKATFFESTGTGGSNPCRNQNALQEWLTHLESDVDNQPLEWIRLMVREDPIRRITASVLLEKILDYYDPDSGHSYYGPCCFGEESEADSQSYKGSVFAEENEEREEEKGRVVGEGTDAEDSDNTSHEVGSSSPNDRTDKTLVSKQQAAESGATVLFTKASNAVGIKDSKGSEVPKDPEMSSQFPANNLLGDSSTSSNTLPVAIWGEQTDAALPILRSDSISAGEYQKDSRYVAGGFRDAVEKVDKRSAVNPYNRRLSAAIMRHSQANASSKILPTAPPENLEQSQTESGGIKIPQASSDESFDESSGSNLGSQETSPPSKRDLASWWKPVKKNTKQEEKKGILTTLSAA